jgi:hypothetical protein
MATSDTPHALLTSWLAVPEINPCLSGRRVTSAEGVERTGFILGTGACFLQDIDHVRVEVDRLQKSLIDQARILSRGVSDRTRTRYAQAEPSQGQLQKRHVCERCVFVIIQSGMIYRSLIPSLPHAVAILPRHSSKRPIPAN